MRSTSQTMFAIVRETGDQAIAAANASQEANTNVQTAAAATEELSASTAQINNRALHSAQIANKAADETERAGGVVQELHATASEIGEVVRMIDEIASQTIFWRSTPPLKPRARAKPGAASASWRARSSIWLDRPPRRPPTLPRVWRRSRVRRNGPCRRSRACAAPSAR